MTDEELKAIEARANAATPGPWMKGVTYDHGRNAEFIAASRTDVPALAAEVRRLKEENASMGKDWDMLLGKYDRVKMERERLKTELRATLTDWEYRGEVIASQGRLLDEAHAALSAALKAKETK